MAISALVLLCDTQQSRHRIATRLANDERITVGPPNGACLPLVTETRTLLESRDLAKDLEQLPGVLRVDLVFANFEELPPI